jgi:hypothetical protein
MSKINRKGFSPLYLEDSQELLLEPVLKHLNQHQLLKRF